MTEQGFIELAITATDLATNPFDSDSISIPNNLFIDNIIPEATFVYENISNPDLDNIGIGGDTVRVTISMNEPIKATEPIPTLSLLMDLVMEKVVPLWLGKFLNQQMMKIPYGFFNLPFLIRYKMMEILTFNL